MNERGTRLAIEAAERGWVPDALVRAGIRRLLAQRLRDSVGSDAAEHARRQQELLDRLRAEPIAAHADVANAQHYEVPPEFFERVLGPHLKYSCCLWEAGTRTLAEAEQAALAETAAGAQLEDGQRVLELGCGWGSLSLWTAERYPQSHITAVSNSAAQRAFVESRAAERGLSNLTVVTADVNGFDPAQQFDRVVSVEMFEHVRNVERLLERVAGWLEADGLFFAHVFCHRTTAYAFETETDADWMTRHFFRGGMMPSADWFTRFPRDLRVVARRDWNGRHYARTAEAWLRNLDAAREAVLPILARAAGPHEARRAFHRWRLFFLACAELFGWNAGREWHVAHTLAARADRPGDLPADRAGDEIGVPQGIADARDREPESVGVDGGRSVAEGEMPTDGSGSVPSEFASSRSR